MGSVDLPAMLNYVLTYTGEDKIFYAGHSMGTTSFMVMANTHPEMNDKIVLANFVAPVGFLGHVKGPLRLIAPYATTIDVG